MLKARSVPQKYLFLMLFHIKTLRGTVRAFQINEINFSQGSKLLYWGSSFIRGQKYFNRGGGIKKNFK
jgi:hypothetical protein